MRQSGSSEDNVQLFLQFLGSQANLFYVFIQHNRQSLLATNLAGVLEIDDESAQKLADAIIALGLSPTSSGDAKQIVKALTTALCGSDEGNIREKCLIFLNAFRDIHVCARIPELDSRSLFKALCRKLSFYLNKNNEEFQSLLTMILVRVCQRGLHSFSKLYVNYFCVFIH